MEKYIDKCLDSLLIPEIDDVEVWVVNDGSKDRSSEIAHEYAAKYPQSINVIDKENGNYGSCINAALPKCTGRYVKVLDADDTFDTGVFSKFVRLLPSLDSDVIFTKRVCVNADGKGTDIPKFHDDKIIFNKEYSDINGKLPRMVLMHWVTYKTNIFKKFKYFQPEGVSYTDTIWAMIPMAYCDTGIFLDLVLYRYLVGREGQTMNSSQMRKSIDNLKTNVSCMLDYLENTQADNIKKILENYTLGFVLYVYNVIRRFQSEESMTMLKEIDSILKLQSPEIFNKVDQYPINKNINYKVFKEIRESNYNPKFKIPIIINLHLKSIVYYEAFKNKLRMLL